MAPDLVGMEDELQRPPLHFAVEYGHEEVVEMLMECAKSNARKGETMFHAAIRSGHDKIVSQLLDHRPQLIDVVDLKRWSPLQLAAECGRGSIVAELFARRQPRLAEVGGTYKKNLLHFAAEFGYDTIMAELLVEQPHLVDVAGYRSVAPLHLAAQNGHHKIVEQLLAHKPLSLVDVKDSSGQSALHFATLGEHQRVVEQLLAHTPGVIDAKDEYENTALSIACRHTHPELVACLLAHKPAVVTETMVWEPLRLGTDSKKVLAVLKLVLAHKPELVESVDSQNNTLLHRVFGFERNEEFYGDSSSDDEEDDDDLVCGLLFNDQLMITVWQLCSPNILRVTNRDKETPLGVAVRCKNDFAIGLVQWKHSLDEIAEVFATCYATWPHEPLVDQLHEVLVVSLNKDVLTTVWEYLGFIKPKRVPPPAKKRKKMAEAVE